MRNIALRISYDGSAYHGWQTQPGLPTVQETLLKAARAVCGQQSGPLIGCGRTDAGVHALRYCANFRTDSTIPIEKVPLALNTHLPSDIAVWDAVEAPFEFNAIGDCLQKEYVYKIYNSRLPDPFLHQRACFYPALLNLDLMNEAASAFVGTHDFAAVRSVGTPTKTTVRTIKWCRCEQQGNLIRIYVCADGFLYNMVRAIVGTLVYASHGKLRPEDIPSLLEQKDRRLTGPTMPAHGLYMNHPYYTGEVAKMMDKQID